MTPHQKPKTARRMSKHPAGGGIWGKNAAPGRRGTSVPLDGADFVDKVLGH